MSFEILTSDDNFLGIEGNLSSFEDSKVVIQSLPYEQTSSYLTGSVHGPNAILEASHYVEFYDEELDKETFRDIGICTLKPYDFNGKVNQEAISFIEEKTDALLDSNKFVVSLGAEHTVSFGLVKSFSKKFNNLSVLQIDAHSDLREAYQGNPYSHASVMARVHDLKIPITQVGIRAQCIEEANLIKESDNIHTFYHHQMRGNSWIEDAIESLSDEVYVTIDADGFDPSLIGAVGTPEPGGLSWDQGLDLFRALAHSGKKVVGFDVVEVLPKEGEILSQYSMAKLVYKLLGYLNV